MSRRLALQPAARCIGKMRIIFKCYLRHSSARRDNDGSESWKKSLQFFFRVALALVLSLDPGDIVQSCVNIARYNVMAIALELTQWIYYPRSSSRRILCLCKISAHVQFAYMIVACSISENLDTCDKWETKKKATHRNEWSLKYWSIFMKCEIWETCVATTRKTASISS